MLKRAYVEITNVCNLRCSFCPGTKRPGRRMDTEEFTLLLPKLRPFTDHIYFHLMGEPLCHPELATFLQIAGQHGFRVIITTNGTLLPKQQQVLLAAPALHKINISLHAFEANDLAVPFRTYLQNCLEFGQAANGEKLVVYRLWNQGGADELNQKILETIHQYFPQEWRDNLEKAPSTPPVPQWHYGWWGQLVTGKGTINPKTDAFVRENGYLKYNCLSSHCTFENMRKHLKEVYL